MTTTVTLHGNEPSTGGRTEKLANVMQLAAPAGRRGKNTTYCTQNVSGLHEMNLRAPETTPSRGFFKLNFTSGDKVLKSNKQQHTSAFISTLYQEVTV